MAYPNNNGKPIFREFLTPVGLLVHLYHDKPMMQTKENSREPLLDENGVPIGEYKVTVAWQKAMVQQGILNDLVAMAQAVKAEAWPQSVQPGAFFHLQPFLRDGDDPQHNTKGKEYLRGCFYLNFKQKAKPAKNLATGKIEYTGGPGFIGPYNEDIMAVDLYGGCTGRVSGVMFGSEYMGKNYISTRLNNIQKFEDPIDGKRIGGAERPDARSQFQPLRQGQAPNANTGDPFAGLGGAASGQNPFGGQQGQGNPFGQPQNPFGGQQGGGFNPNPFGGGRTF